jgi:hypothetical protein
MSALRGEKPLPRLNSAYRAPDHPGCLLETDRALSSDRKQRFAVLRMGPPGFRRPIAGKFGQAIDARVCISAENLKEPIGSPGAAEQKLAETIRQESGGCQPGE